MKVQCCQMFHLVGSGKFVTAPIITEVGEPIRDPIVLQQLNLEKESASPTKGNGSYLFSQLRTYEPNYF